MSEQASIFAVVDTGAAGAAGAGWEALELFHVIEWNEPMYYMPDTGRLFKPADILLGFPTMEAAQEALTRAQDLEKTLRPLWQAAVAHELDMRNRMMSAVHTALRGTL